MFDRIFGEYLVEKTALTKIQLTEVYAEQDNSRVRLGLIAVSEKLMDNAQIEEVNKLQAIMDKRFGDIAVEKGYLSEGQVSRLLKVQGNKFLVFMQTILNKNYLTMNELTAELEQYQRENNFTQTDMENLKSGELDRVVSVLIEIENPMIKDVIKMMLRTASRLVDYHVFISPPRIVDKFESNMLVLQAQKGNHDVLTCFAGENDSILQIAQGYAGKEIVSDNEDAVDAIGELLNCMNGLFVSDSSRNNVDLDMQPPEYYNGQRVCISGESLYVLPVNMCGCTVEYIVAIDSKYKIQN